ncbi:MAG: hypothetical protein DRQ10_08095 [Candidatus Hydrothermota bacterium]|nr:MAG: hypothetical protein DRQ10_08095 [Candidatus Hydrothermae bacterium]
MLELIASFTVGFIIASIIVRATCSIHLDSYPLHPADLKRNFQQLKAIADNQTLRIKAPNAEVEFAYDEPTDNLIPIRIRLKGDMPSAIASLTTILYYYMPYYESIRRAIQSATKPPANNGGDAYA